MIRILVALLFIFAGSTQIAPLFVVTAAELNENIVWIDVRSARDYRHSHIEGAINIPHGDIGHKIFQAVPDVFKEVHIYDGKQGTFAGLALEMLMEMGFQEVINEGGYEALLAKQSSSGK